MNPPRRAALRANDVPCSPDCPNPTKSHRSAFAVKKCRRTRQQVGHGLQVAPASSRVRSDSPRTVVGEPEQETSVYEIVDEDWKRSRVQNLSVVSCERLELSGSELHNVRFTNVVDQLSTVGSRGDRVALLARRVSDSDFSDSTWTNFTVGTAVEIEDCVFAGSVLPGSRWDRQSVVRNCSMTGVNLNESQFTLCHFESVDLSGSDMSECVFVLHSAGNTKFDDVEIDMVDFSSADLNSTSWNNMTTQGRIIFVDEMTKFPATEETYEPSDFGRELATRALTRAQYDSLMALPDASETRLREALIELSPAFTPAYSVNNVGERGELLRRAMEGESLAVLAGQQRKLWLPSREHNKSLVEDYDELL